MKRIVVIGGGFAGMWGALAAARKIDLSRVSANEVEISLINRDGFHCIRPRLYENDLTEARIPLAPVLEPAGVKLIEGQVQAIHPANTTISVGNGNSYQKIAYDRLVYAAGSILSMLDIPGAAAHSFNIDNFGEAERLNTHLEQLPSLADNEGRFTVVVVGAGFTGLEIACELPSRLVALSGAGQPRVILVDQEPVLGATLGDSPRPEIERVVNALGIETRLGVRVSKIGPDNIAFEDGDMIPTQTVVWTGGALGSPLGKTLEAPLDDLGRVAVDGHMRVKGVPEVFAAGDAAQVPVDDTHIAVMSCQHAMPQGRYAGHNAAADLLGELLLDYRQPTYVTCLGLGPNNAIYTEGWEREVRNTDAYQLKRDILTQWIYPPSSGDRAEILAAAEPVTMDYY